MKYLRVLVCLAPVVAFAGFPLAANGQKKSFETFGKIVRLDPRLDKLLAKDAQLEKLAGGLDPVTKKPRLVWTEGPVWVKNGGYLLFSDIPNNVINKWQEGVGLTKFIYPAGYRGKDRRIGVAGDEPGTNGLRLDPQGRLVACQHGDRRVARLDATLDANTQPMIGLASVKWTTLADKYMGKRLNSPNDLVFAKNGDLYFTDPPYGLEKGAEDLARELDFQGVYRIRKGGELELLTKEMSRPNGIALSPDDKTLYVANSDFAKPVWMAFPLGENGKLGAGRVFYDSSKWVAEKLPGAPDGMKVDVEGNLWATGPGGVLILTPEGTLLGMIETGTNTANCAFGDDGATLYIAANHDIARIRTLTKGLGF
jgi:gluconolactonase